jgi:hypothetical protein
MELAIPSYWFRAVATAEAQLPPLLRLMILAARRIVGDVDYDLIKIALDGKKLSFMRYPDFDDTPHPELALAFAYSCPLPLMG